MGPKGAAYAAKIMNLRTVIPIHWGTFPALAGTPDKLRTALNDLAGTTAEVKELKPGEIVVFESADDIAERSQSFYQ